MRVDFQRDLAAIKFERIGRGRSVTVLGESGLRVTGRETESGRPVVPDRRGARAFWESDSDQVKVRRGRKPKEEEEEEEVQWWQLGINEPRNWSRTATVKNR